ncbi:DNA-binding protein, partial [Pseudomonas carnis]|nr:DNA-binding protein [Pseudomonas carnis]
MSPPRCVDLPVFILLLLALVAAGLVAQQFRLFERAWFNWQV